MAASLAECTHAVILQRRKRATRFANRLFRDKSVNAA
jgi:hypothetical protein